MLGKFPMEDVIVVLPGILGSVLQRGGKDIWGLSGSAAVRFLKNPNVLVLPDDPNQDDGVVATRLLPDLQIIPRFWRIDGYTKIAEYIKATFDVAQGENYYEFPYDWRRDNRLAARRLQKESEEWLSRWRDNRHPNAKLILVAHSMGGLVARYFLEVLDGWKNTRVLISEGTPYRGSLNALDALSNGVRKGPFDLLDLSKLVRSFPSVYQLLPIYRCYDTGPGKLLTLEDAGEIPNIDLKGLKFQDAMLFHKEIKERVKEHEEKDAYRKNKWRIEPIAGTHQITFQSARRNGRQVKLLTDYEGQDHGGDGTVPHASAAIPFELAPSISGMATAMKHSSIQNAEATLIQLESILRFAGLDLSKYRAAPRVNLSLEADDLYLTDTPATIRAKASHPTGGLTAHIVNSETGDSTEVNLSEGRDDWHEVKLSGLTEGTYRVSVSAPTAPSIEDVFMVMSP